MANLKFKSLKNIDFIKKATVAVGHNRTVTKVRDIDATVYSFRLHGHEVARLLVNDGGMRQWLSLKHCGYATRTTVAAIQDALKLFGFWGNASCAGGKLSAFAYQRYEPSIEAPRWHRANDVIDLIFHGSINEPREVYCK